MRLGISNIAWDPVEDESVGALLRDQSIDAIDIAPGKYFPDAACATDEEIDSVRERWADRGISITGMQSLLFGTEGLNVFGEGPVQAAMLDHLGAICTLAGKLGAPRLVFGSPRNRDRSGLSDQEAMDIAVPFFRRLGDRAADAGVFVCLEPNPTRYGANFMTTSTTTATVVRAVDHTAIRMQFDVGALAINGEAAEAVLVEHGDLIGHVHASEPDLVPVGDGQSDHDASGRALLGRLPDHLVMIEMVATQHEGHLESIERAIGAASHAYRPEMRS